LKSKILLLLYQNNGGYVSGQRIASELKISRVAVKKHIDALIDKGYKISALKKSGYALTDFDDIFDETSVKMFLSLKNIDIDTAFYSDTDSTNEQAKKLYGQKKHGIVAALKQSGGKGRLGRKFISEEGGVYVTYYRPQPDITPFDAVKTVIACAVAAHKTLIKYCACKIKWTNDILCGNKKICGILCEMLTESESVNFIVQGAGFNINNDIPQSLNDIARSLKRITGQNINRAKFCAEFIYNLINCNDMLFGGNFDKLLKYYKENCVTLNNNVTVSGRESFNGYAFDIDENGFLIVKTEGGIKKVAYGDVSVSL
jgi:BirA family biotin operon repressor/biotin-[acetyl-CoA-carboxylase] ligase